MMVDNKVESWRKKAKALEDVFRESWAPHYKEIVDYMAPRKGRYLTSYNPKWEDNRGDKKHQKIFNGTALEAIRVAGAGLQGGLNSPSSPWFTLTLSDTALMEYGPVKDWLYRVREMMMQVFARSNFYTAVHQCYLEMVRFGTATMLIDEDFDTVVHFRPLTVGEYWLSSNHKNIIDEMYRPLAMSAKQMRQKFGKEKLPTRVANALKDNQPFTSFDVMHVIEPNMDFDPSKLGQMRYTSAYYGVSCMDSDYEILTSLGYRVKPFVTGRWDVTGNDVYGNSPAMDALPDVKQLNEMEKIKLKALGKMVDPPIKASPAVKKNGGVSLIPGGITYVDEMAGATGATPLYQIQPQLREFVSSMEVVESRIRSAFSNNLFLAVLNNERTMTATEAAQKYEEKLMMLGPVIEGLQSEFLDAIIDRVYDVIENMGMLPEIPEELQNGTQIKVQYTSLLAQAQKMVGTTAIEKTVGFTLQLAQANPEALDKLDFDQVIDVYSEMNGIAPQIVRSDEAVQKLRQGRQVQQQAQQLAQAAPALNQAAQAAKAASETTINGQPLADRLAAPAQ